MTRSTATQTTITNTLAAPTTKEVPGKSSIVATPPSRLFTLKTVMIYGDIHTVSKNLLPQLTDNFNVAFTTTTGPTTAIYTALASANTREYTHATRPRIIPYPHVQPARHISPSDRQGCRRHTRSWDTHRRCSNGRPLPTCPIPRSPCGVYRLGWRACGTRSNRGYRAFSRPEASAPETVLWRWRLLVVAVREDRRVKAGESRVLKTEIVH